MNYYIFASDPHGTGQPWIDKVENALKLYPTAQIVFGGDYIDGRKYSRETVNYVRSKQSEGHIALMGNHEQLMLDAVNKRTPEAIALWAMNGNKSTVRSFCGQSWSKPKRVSMFASYAAEFVDWASKLPDVYETDNIVFVHAGIDWNPALIGNPVNLTTHFNKLWMRDEYLYGRDKDDIRQQKFAHNRLGKTIVSGHTPTTYIEGWFDDGSQRFINGIPMSCPVVVVQYAGERPRYFTDGGCHSSIPENTGNVLVLDDAGNEIEIF